MTSAPLSDRLPPDLVELFQQIDFMTFLDSGEDPDDLALLIGALAKAARESLNSDVSPLRDRIAILSPEHREIATLHALPLAVLLLLDSYRLRAAVHRLAVALSPQPLALLALPQAAQDAYVGLLRASGEVAGAA